MYKEVINMVVLVIGLVSAPLIPAILYKNKNS